PDSHAKTPAGRVDCAPSTLSVRSAAADDRADGACQDAQVEEHREILDVEEVEPGVQMQRQLAAAVHLPPSRHAGWDQLPGTWPRRSAPGAAPPARGAPRPGSDRAHA